MTKRQQQQNLPPSLDGGYTIIESLVAMIVVSVLMIAIAPVMAFSVATRVQARRTELATQAGKAYIDALRTGAIKFGGSGFPKAAPANDLAGTPPPVVGDTYCVDMGGSCDSSNKDFNKDFYVQGAWLNQNATGTDPTSKGYQLLVRVYRADSFAQGVTLRAPKDAKQSVVGSGLGDKTIPVVEMSTEIPAAGTPSYSSISDRLKKP
ncbi:prepilin-type N-terminal cleavage/methylation domain-containing protein [Microcoleus sp. CAWBG50]|uniref:prepilin-type N-terminal cleavage/methylation domain-containing protein n=1 Tax=Microcoleus sp. CAWBG50 TaxID=2841646 RepID=UPI0025EE170D|nr:prepilin-type N-terminal cleavage/methylation domain-containing protein [Microcoleus sp. CAWBG50]